MNDKKLQQPTEVDKQRPPYEMKIILWDGENAIRNLLEISSNVFNSHYFLPNK